MDEDKIIEECKKMIPEILNNIVDVNVSRVKGIVR